ncbi:hypothetical protein QQG74_14815 [Micromonospora sp. FIMYZ51]
MSEDPNAATVAVTPEPTAEEPPVPVELWDEPEFGYDTDTAGGCG